MKASSVVVYDVAIVGAGPAALTCLSGIQEPYALDELSTDRQTDRVSKRRSQISSKPKKVAVIDPHSEWMHQWKHNFDCLDIRHLRSTAMAHPDMFDPNALLAFATAQGRSDELMESGCAEIKSLLPLGQSQIGLWKLPTLQLFVDFCDFLVQRLKHDYICDWVSSITTATDDDDVVAAPAESHNGGAAFAVTLQGGQVIHAKAIILAMGLVGTPIVPRGLKDAPRLVSWQQLNDLPPPPPPPSPPANTTRREHVLVVGGGLTAVQAAQKCVRRGCSTVLCSRRPLVERHFDLPIEWFDMRSSNKCLSDFYHQSLESRMELLATTRGGGSVPKWYMDQLRAMEATSSSSSSSSSSCPKLLQRIVGHVQYKGCTESGRHLVQLHQDGDKNEEPPREFDKIVLACGMKANARQNALYAGIAKEFPVRGMIHGFPDVSEDLEWGDNIFVVGGMGGLNTGPDAANLVGMRRAARIIAKRLGFRQWQHQDSSSLSFKVNRNPFSAFEDSDSDSDDDDDSDEE